MEPVVTLVKAGDETAPLRHVMAVGGRDWGDCLEPARSDLAACLPGEAIIEMIHVEIADDEMLGEVRRFAFAVHNVGHSFS